MYDSRVDIENVILKFLEITVFLNRIKTASGKLIENIKAIEITILKELGKITP
jgi:hypothetical protein